MENYKKDRGEVGRQKATVKAIVASLMFVAGAMFASRAIGASDEKLPGWIVEWQAFAEKTGRSDDQNWAKLISDPRAVELEQDWKKWRGYDGPELVAKARAAGQIPAELKPGLIINKDNYKSFPWLSKFMTGPVMDRVADPSWYGFKNVRIVPTVSYYYSKEKLQGQYAEKGEFELDYSTGALKIKNCTTCEAGKVVPEDWGQKSLKFPFAPQPKDGLQLAWMYILHNVDSDNLYFNPIEFILQGADGKIERTYTAALWWKNFWGRASYDPVGHVPGASPDDYQAGAIFFLHPLDVKGLCGVRTRHFDPNTDDSFQVFLPSLKRTRILAGSDTQDPLCAGCDILWDDWRAYWTRMDARKFDFKLVGDGFILTQPERGMVGDGFTVGGDGNFAEIDMELRPVWILEITDKTGNYVYSKRIEYIDKDWWYMQEQQSFDRQGRMWRDWTDARYWDPRTGEGMWRNVLIWDPINKHATTLRMNVDFDQAKHGTKQEYFDIDTLRTYR